MRVLVVDDHVELAQQVARALEARGHQASTAYSGHEAIEEIERDPPDAAVVDLLLPDMLGTQVLDALARQAPPVPAVAISGVFRGDRYRREATVGHGARAFMEKPFSSEDLVLTVEALQSTQGASGLPTSRPRPRPAASEAELDEILDLTEEVLTPWEEAQEDDALVEEALEALAEALPEPDADRSPGAPDDEVVDPRAWLGGLDEPAESPPPSPAPAPASPPERARARWRQMGFVEDLVLGDPEAGPTGEARPTGEADAGTPVDGRVAERPEAPSPPPPRTPRPAVLPAQGALSRLRVPALLTACHREGLSGRLELERGIARRTVFLERGIPIYAASNLATDRLLAFALRAGHLTQADVDRTLARAKATNTRVGEVLVATGLMDRQALGKLVRDQATRILWSTFAWDDGTWRLRREDEPPPTPVRVEASLPALVLEGLAHDVSRATLRAALPDEAVPRPHPEPAFPADALPLEAHQRPLVEAADGTKTVADLLAITDVGEPTGRAILAALLSLEVLALGDRALARRSGFIL